MKQGFKPGDRVVAIRTMRVAVEYEVRLEDDGKMHWRQVKFHTPRTSHAQARADATASGFPFWSGVRIGNIAPTVEEVLLEEMAKS